MKSKRKFSFNNVSKKRKYACLHSRKRPKKFMPGSHSIDAQALLGPQMYPAQTIQETCHKLCRTMAIALKIQSKKETLASQAFCDNYQINKKIIAPTEWWGTTEGSHVQKIISILTSNTIVHIHTIKSGSTRTHNSYKSKKIFPDEIYKRIS